MESSSSTCTKVFISYSHKDAKYLEQLVEHLAYFERNNLIEFWSDKKITPGAQWREEIKRAIECTTVAVLLISPSFLASKFIAENELPPLLHAAEKEGAIILPVIVRPSNFEETELANFQAVNSPSIPVAKMRGYKKDEFWAKVVRDIIKAVAPQQAVEEMSKSSFDNASPIPKQANLRNQQYQSNQEEHINISYTKGVDEEALAKLRVEMQRQREADNLLLEARKFAASLIEKDGLVQKAVELWPPYKQKELRQLGIEMSIAVIDGYDPITQMGMRMAGFRRLERNDLVWLSTNAVSYLQENVLETTTPDAEGLLYLASMSGYQQQFDDMMIIIDKAVQIDGEIKERFQQQKILLTLIRAVGSDQMKLERLRKRLGILPDSKRNFCKFIQDFDLTDFHGYIKWIGIKRLDAAGERGIFIIHITPPYEQNKGLVSASTLSVESWQTENIANGDLVSISKLYGVLHISFALLCLSE